MLTASPANINDDLPAVAVANPASEEGAIEMIAVPNNNDIESAVSTDADSTISSSSNAAEDAGQQRTTNRFVKRGGSLVVAAAALAVIGAGSVHLAGRPTTNFSSSKQVALSSGDIEIEGFTFVDTGICLDGNAEGGNPYDYVLYSGGVADAEECANRCSACPGGGQTGNNGEKLVLRGFEYVGDGVGCYCLVENVAEGELDSVCEDEGDVDTFDEFTGTGEIESSTNDDGVECWKVNSKSSKSRKSGSKGGKRG